MSYLIKPANYRPLLDLQQTEQGIKMIKEFFQQNLSSELRLRRVTAPLFVLKGMGINDDLSGRERPVTFPIKDLGDAEAEVVHSLAKWKRVTLADYSIEPGYGIYTDMNAIRADEELGNLHSLYVDQWDWERVITEKDRTVTFLKDTVSRIYAAMLRTEFMVCESYPQIKPFLPKDIFFIHAEELRQLYPDMTSKQRESEITRKYGAVFIIGIGCKLSDGKEHDLRAPDYDDYTTVGENNLPGLNGDLLVWDSVIDRAVELSSMGIRVNQEALIRQLALAGKEERKKLYFHKRLLEGTLPLSIGGGIGQSRLCMVYLRKAHIGEIQASIWPTDMREECAELGMPLI
ncbi:MAG: aspartate--ammonia ligase [Bacteroidaceae bacterium]|nr:aspartate--ammonia ligase [Bacteroidaceae bacterium]